MVIFHSYVSLPEGIWFLHSSSKHSLRGKQIKASFSGSSKAVWGKLICSAHRGWLSLRLDDCRVWCFSVSFFFCVDGMVWEKIGRKPPIYISSYKLYIYMYPRDKPWIPVDFPLNLNQYIVYDTIGIFSRPVSSRRRCSKTSTGTRRSWQSWW
jgi:hypothetical protein